MDYKKIYNKIIENRILNPLSDEVYTEIHHIIPRSLGGSNENTNLVKLSAREHFICHLLLSEIYPKETFEWYKMNHAFLMMCTTGKMEKRYLNSRIYELKKNDFSKIMSWNSKGEKNSQYGRPRSTEVREKIRRGVNRRIGKKNDITSKEKKKILRQEEKLLYNFEGNFFNLQKRKKVLQIFGIDLEKDFYNSVLYLKNLLETKYLTEKKSTIKIAEEFNADSETIRNYLILFKIPIRSLSESVKNYFITADVAQR